MYILVQGKLFASFILLFQLILTVSVQVSAQNIYSSQEINEDFLNNAGALVHYDRTHVELRDIDNITVRYESKVTVLNKSQEDLLDFIAGYKEGSSKIKNINISYFDKDGKLIRSVDDKGLDDRSYYDGYSMISDSRYKYLDFETNDFPVTCEVSFEVKHKNTNIPSWRPIPGYNISVLHSSFTIDNQSDVEIFTKERIDNFPHISETSHLNYEARGIPALVEEPYSPKSGVLPVVMFSTDKFVYEKIEGETSDWESLGLWIYNKLLDRFYFNDRKLKEDIFSHIESKEDKKEIVKDIYEYVQENTRYVSIALDEGGIKPMPFDKVHELKYGDCKGLTLYTQALLKQYDIKSEYVIVESGTNHKTSFYNDFASLAQGNHIILRVPMPDDTIWLDCTNHETPMGYLGNFTDDRQVLVVNEKGGVLAKTPRYGIEFNTKKIYVDAVIEDKDMILDIHESVVGADYNTMRSLSYADSEIAERYLRNSLLSNFKNLIISDLFFDFNREKVTANMRLKATSSGDFEVFDNYLLLPINYISLDIPRFKKDGNRKFPVEFLRTYYRENHLKIDIPEGYRLMDTDYTSEIKDTYGEYHLELDQVQSQIVIKRSFRLNEGVYPPEEFNGIKAFFDKIHKQEKLILTFENEG